MSQKNFFLNKLLKIFVLGDYGRGGVEAIRRLLNKDSCIGADFTMVNEIYLLNFQDFFKIFFR